MPQRPHPRQLQILALYARGKDWREIADEFVISPYTVKRHLYIARGMLGAGNSAQAVVICLARGYLELDGDQAVVPAPQSDELQTAAA